MSWLYVAVFIIHGSALYDVVSVDSREACIALGKTRAAAIEKEFPTTPWKLHVKCFPPQPGKNV